MTVLSSGSTDGSVRALAELDVDVSECGSLGVRLTERRGRTSSRRDFLLIATVVGVSASAASWYLWAGRDVDRIELDDAEAFAARLARLEGVARDPTEARLLALPPSFESAAAIGAHDDVSSNLIGGAHEIATTLAGQLTGGVGSLEAVPLGVVQELFERRVRDDFLFGRVTTVDGWFLSETGVRVCRLCALATARVS
jgi:hypothetical protein